MYLLLHFFSPGSGLDEVLPLQTLPLPSSVVYGNLKEQVPFEPSVHNVKNSAIDLDDDREYLTSVTKMAAESPANKNQQCHQEQLKREDRSKEIGLTMSESKPSHSISITGGKVSGQIAQAVGNVTQFQHGEQIGAEKQLTLMEILGLMIQIEELLKLSALSDYTKEKAIKHLEIAKEEIKEKDPDKEYIAKSLQRAMKILKENGNTGHELLKRIEPILTNLLPWLEVSTHFFNF